MAKKNMDSFYESTKKKKKYNLSSFLTKSLNYFNKKKNKKKRIFIFLSNSINPFYNLYIFMINKIKSIFFFRHITEKKNIYPNNLYHPPFYKKKILLENKEKKSYIKALNQKKFLLEKINFIFQNQKKKIYNIFLKFNPKNTLNILKKDIFNSTYPEKKNQHSIQDHAVMIFKCLTLRQEVEKTYIHLNNLLNNNHHLQPHDILITAYNITPYLKYIKNIFSKTKEEKKLLIIAKKKENNHQNLLKTIKNLFQIEKYKFKYTWVLSLLDSELLRKKFSIKKEDLKKIIKWIQKLRVKWGYNTKHLKQISLPNMKIYTWKYAIKRIILGCFFEKYQKNKNQIPPYCVRSKENQIILGNFIHLINCLKNFRKKIKNKKILKNWLPLIKYITNKFFYIPQKYENFFISLEKKWKKIISQGIKSNYLQRIPIELLIQEFFKKKNIFLKNINFMSGLVNIAHISQIEMIPFKIICILGCNNLPKKQKINKNLNLIDKFPCFEDKYYTGKEKNIYLKTIMLAKKYLFLSYCNEEEIKKQKTCLNFINTLKLYFKNNFYNLKNKKNSYYQDYTKKNIIKNIFEIIKIKNENKKRENISKKTKKNFNKIILPFQKYLYIDELINFWKNPIHYFFKKTLKINIKYENFNNISTNEPFFLDYIEKYNINCKILKFLLKKKPTKKIFYDLYKTGHLPYKNIGKIWWNKQKKKKLKNYQKKLKKKDLIQKN